jgi:hypothetical protein
MRKKRKGFDIDIDDEKYSFSLKSLIFNDIKKAISNQEYKDKYSEEDHYAKIISNKEYFLISFKRLIFNEIVKRKYDIKNEDEFDDLVSESYIILIELYDKMQINFNTVYKDKAIIDKTKILQSYIRIAYPGRLFNWWCKWRNLKYIANPKGGKGSYKKIVYDGFDPDIYNYDDRDEYHLSEDEEGVDNVYNHIIREDRNDMFIDSSFDIEEFSINKINLDFFWAAVKEILPDIHFQIFELFYKHSMSYIDIMKKLDINKQKVVTIKWYADQKVKKYFKQYFEDVR